MSNSPAPQSWNLGLSLMAVIPFIGLLILYADLPTWAEVVAVAAIIVLVATGSTLMRRRQGAWRPSESTKQGP